MMCRKYGAHLCYTPMIHSKIFNEEPKCRAKYFVANPKDRPLFVQFAANDPKTLLEAAFRVQNHCDAVDINLGCPQKIASKGNYGSFLLDNQLDLVIRMVSTLKKHLKIPVTCKVRCLKTEKETLYMAKEIEKAGASILTVHGRTRHHNK